jgi:hypothetical protein
MRGMSIREALESVLQCLHDGLDAGDLVAVGEALVGGRPFPDPERPDAEIAHLRRDIPRPAGAAFVHAEESGEWAAYVYKTSKPRRKYPDFVVCTFLRRDGRWRFEGGGYTSTMTGPQDADAVASKVEDMLGWQRPKRRKRSPSYVAPEARPAQAASDAAPALFASAERRNADLTPVASEAVDGAEAHLGATFPAGYREFVLAFGAATYCGRVRVYPPQRIVAELADWRERVTQYFFWDASADLLDAESVRQCIPVADTFTGDELIFHPADPSRLYVLPREEEEIFLVGADLDQALEWLCRSGRLHKKVAKRYVD